MLGERDLMRLSGRFPDGEIIVALHAVEGLEVVQAEEEMLTLAMRDASEMLSEVFGVLERAGATIRETTVTRPSLETLFIKLTGKELRE